MNFKEILNADVKVIGALVRQGYDWWRDELAGLVPEKWRHLGSRQNELIAVPHNNGTYLFYRSGTQVSPPILRPENPVPVTLAVPKAWILCRELDLAQLSAADMRNYVANELDRWTPLDRNQAAFSHVVLARNPETKRSSVRLAVVEKTRAQHSFDRARAAGMTVQRMTFWQEPGIAAPGFDFLKTIGTASQGRPPRDPVKFWWSVVAAVAVLNFGVAIMRDYQDVASLRETVDSQGQTARLAGQIQRRVATEHERRQSIQQQRRLREPLGFMAALSRSLPAAVIVQRYEWDGERVRLTGYKPGAIDLLGALKRAPDVATARNNSRELPPAMELGQPFDIVITFKPLDPA